MEHVRRYEKDLFLFKNYRSVIKDIGIRLLNRNRDLKAAVPVDRIILGSVIIPNAHVCAWNEIDFFDIIADDPSGKTADRLLIFARY